MVKNYDHDNDYWQNVSENPCDLLVFFFLS